MNDIGNTGKVSRRKLLSLSAMAGMTGLAGFSAFQPKSAIAQESSNPDPKENTLIDAHSHMLSGLYRYEKQKRKFDNLKEINLQDLFDQMDEAGIEKFVTVSQGGSNELIIDLQGAFPDRCFGLFGVQPFDRRNAFNRQRLEEFKSAAEDHGIKGMFLGPPYDRFYANDRRVYPFYEAAVEYDTLVFFHYGGGVGGGGGRAASAPMKYAQPVHLDDVVIDFPDLRINVEHMAYPRTEELFALMKHAPNVFTDICELFTRPTVLAWYLLMAKEYGVIDRIVWGTDYDIYWYDDFDFKKYFKKVKDETSWIKYDLNKILQKSGWDTLTQKEINGILYTNAKKMLKL